MTKLIFVIWQDEKLQWGMFVGFDLPSSRHILSLFALAPWLLNLGMEKREKEKKKKKI